ncbi:hypothetical protein EDC04DRAFT_2609929 [Pisolithus marmoratus]|nr:hypothetical protein EDC04DRAFT_2609929 [Pisolithus marmoratus]
MWMWVRMDGWEEGNKPVKNRERKTNIMASTPWMSILPARHRAEWELSIGSSYIQDPQVSQECAALETASIQYAGPYLLVPAQVVAKQGGMSINNANHVLVIPYHW